MYQAVNALQRQYGLVAEERGSETKVGRSSSGFRTTEESATIKTKGPE